jgi:MFS superfamily sulfate permease-like transporter
LDIPSLLAPHTSSLSSPSLTIHNNNYNNDVDNDEDEDWEEDLMFHSNDNDNNSIIMTDILEGTSEDSHGQEVILSPASMTSYQTTPSFLPNGTTTTTISTTNAFHGIPTNDQPQAHLFPKKQHPPPYHEHQLQQPPPHHQNDNNNKDVDNPLYISIVYGAINCTIVIPVVMSFGNIIYREDAFAPYMPVLIKLTLVSGLVHQVCFSSFSTLKFAVGSVQDAGLIFLSRMAADMVAYCHAQGWSDDSMLATVTVGLALATALLGIGLIIMGQLGLARYVQMLPTCVVAGYLAYIGWFVGYSGIGIMVGSSSLTVSLVLHNILYVVPGVVGGTFIYLSVQQFKHVVVLPCCITLLLLTFYLILAVTGLSVDQATEHGWIRKTEQTPVWYHTWDFLKLDLVVWSAFPQLWLTWSGMLVVVALSSSLDVAAIELEMKRPLNYNKELTMVGISNAVSGLTGGYTGSYIFSQSIFSLRIGIRSRMAGFSLAFFQLGIILVPFPILSYVPNFFYGSLLSMICMDLMYEWLWEFRNKVTPAEYLIGLSTFALIHLGGVEYGILVGVTLYVVCRQLRINVGELKQIPTQEDHQQHHHHHDHHHSHPNQHHHNPHTNKSTIWEAQETLGTVVVGEVHPVEQRLASSIEDVDNSRQMVMTKDTHHGTEMERLISNNGTPMTTYNSR